MALPSQTSEGQEVFLLQLVDKTLKYTWDSFIYEPWQVKKKLKRFGVPLLAGGVPPFPFLVKKHILDTLLERAGGGLRSSWDMDTCLLLPAPHKDWPGVTAEETVRKETLNIYEEY